MASKIELDRLGESSHFIIVEVDFSLCIKKGNTVKLLESIVQVIDIGLMMFFMVNLK